MYIPRPGMLEHSSDGEDFLRIRPALGETEFMTTEARSPLRVLSAGTAIAQAVSWAASVINPRLEMRWACSSAVQCAMRTARDGIALFASIMSSPYSVL